ncbi:unnamed protein product [Zymoseptoria tritici ST99CH_1E4]|uniref:Thioesterase domain-containing protein n=1 Tax=Zymoseptoria tritici ST99CH_1E4 TaxID=1276532 RepID=A0A2H1H094_ZYMTR|nr:unnamed protein product [Zymoseptoria tritici ST99CH_1E4]
MSGVTRLPAVAATLTVAGLVVYTARHFGAGTNMLKLAAAAFALANLKHLPGFWHLRVLRGIIYQIYFQKTPIRPKHLFAPLITQSYNTPYDCDYNFHKSNSTYFADLDVARAHHVSAITREGIARLRRGDQEGLPKSNVEAKGQYIVALGGVTCFFQRQIEPLQQFEIYTRVQSWDRKWLYVVSHIVKKGAIKPDSYVLQPWKNRENKGTAGKKNGEQEEDLTKYIFATSLSRYVFKKGRLTINPEIVLERSRLLPPRPAGVGYPPRTEEASGTSSGTPLFEPATPSGEKGGKEENMSNELRSRLAGVKGGEAQEDEEWTWDDMEKERLRGLELASHFDALGGIHGELRGGDVLGKFGDYW